MTNQRDDYSYDWNLHFWVQADLRALDDFFLQMTGQRPLQPDSVQKHLHPEFNKVVNWDTKNYSRLLSHPVKELIVLADHHAAMCASRAGMIVDYLQDLIEIFPERHWVSFLSSEIHNKEQLLEDIQASLDTVGLLYMANGQQYCMTARWMKAQQEMELADERFNGLPHGSLAADGSPLTEAVLQSRSLKLAEKQEYIAKKTLDHAWLQMVLTRESLRLSATMGIMPPHLKAPLRAMIDSYVDVAGNLMIAADFTLDEAADLRNASYQSRDLRRPVF